MKNAPGNNTRSTGTLSAYKGVMWRISSGAAAPAAQQTSGRDEQLELHESQEVARDLFAVHVPAVLHQGTRKQHSADPRRDVSRVRIKTLGEGVQPEGLEPEPS